MIFAGAGVLLSVAVVLDHHFSDISDTGPIQAAKDDNAGQDALIKIFERIENSFRGLEEYAEAPTTAMKDIVEMIMFEVLGIFAIVTKEIKQNRASKLIPDDMLAITDRNISKSISRSEGGISRTR